MGPLERLEAIDAIKRLKARRVRALDGKDWATYEALHAPDHVSSNDNEPRWVGSKANTERLAKLLTADITTVHHAHTPEIELIDATHATGIWAMEDWLFWKQGGEDHWLHGWGHYHETYERRDGVWLFTNRSLRRIRVETSPGAKLGQR